MTNDLGGSIVMALDTEILDIPPREHVTYCSTTLNRTIYASIHKTTATSPRMQSFISDIKIKQTAHSWK
jgi:hypothetical protein